MGDWQLIETAPKDGTPFVALQGEIVFCAFFRRNPNYKAAHPVTLQVMMRPNRYTAAGKWFRPTHWIPLREPPS